MSTTNPVLLRWLSNVRAVVERHRLPILIIAFALFLFGTVWSIHKLDLDLASIEFVPIVLVLLVLVPVGLLVSSWNLMVLARIVGTRITLYDAIAATAFGRVAEIMPVPGAALVRAGALLKSGAGVGGTLSVLAWSSIMALAMAGLLAGIAFFQHDLVAATILTGASIAGFLFSVFWVARRAPPSVLASLLLVRVAMLSLSVMRILACFAAVSITTSVSQALIFVVGVTLTTQAGIVPAGLGVGEAVSAALALLVGMSPAGAFLASALNRICGLLASGVISLAIMGGRLYRRPASL